MRYKLSWHFFNTRHKVVLNVICNQSWGLTLGLVAAFVPLVADFFGEAVDGRVRGFLPVMIGGLALKLQGERIPSW